MRHRRQTAGWGPGVGVSTVREQGERLRVLFGGARAERSWVHRVARRSSGLVSELLTWVVHCALCSESCYIQRDRFTFR